jgi:hypothetical protein
MSLNNTEVKVLLVNISEESDWLQEADDRFDIPAAQIAVNILTNLNNLGVQPISLTVTQHEIVCTFSYDGNADGIAYDRSASVGN